MIARRSRFVPRAASHTGSAVRRGAGFRTPAGRRPWSRAVSGRQLWFQATVKLLPPDSAEVVALVVLPEAMLILSGP